MTKIIFCLCRRVFNFDVATLDYQQYIDNWVIGSRRFLLKLNDNSIPDAKRKYHFLFWLDFIVKTVFYAFVFYMVFKSYTTSNSKVLSKKPEFVDLLH